MLRGNLWSDCLVSVCMCVKARFGCVVSRPIAQIPKEPEIVAKLKEIYFEHVLLESN